MKKIFAIVVLPLLFFTIPSWAYAAPDSTGQYLRIALQSHSFADGGWKCETRGEGEIERISMDEYFKSTDAATTLPDGTVQIPDMPVPGGVVEFYFRASRPGLVNLRVTRETVNRETPLAEANFRIAVFSDLTLFVVEESEKYDW